jgi:hypothetical protein
MIYTNYKSPPEPPCHLWLQIDFTKIDFNDMNHIKMIYTYIPETYTTLNTMYKIHNKNMKSYIDIRKKYDFKINPPKIMKRFKKID